MPSETPLPKTSPSCAFLGIAWAITGITTIALIARLYIRHRRFRHIFWDDAFVVVAWALSIPLGAQLTLTATRPDSLQSGFTSRLAVQLSFYTCVWSIKISYLIFFRSIGGTKFHGLKTYWSVTLAITILSYLVAWSLNPYDCFIKKGMKACATDPTVNQFLPTAFSVACFLDIVTDMLIMAIPYIILRHVTLTLRQRLTLYSLFSLAVVTIAIALVRLALTWRDLRGTLNITWIIFLTQVDANTSIIVACASSFRILFTQPDHQSFRSQERISAPKLTLRMDITNIDFELDAHDSPAISFGSEISRVHLAPGHREPTELDGKKQPGDGQEVDVPNAVAISVWRSSNWPKRSDSPSNHMFHTSTRDST